MKMNVKIKTTDAYIASCQKEIQPTLKKIRALVRKECPKAIESISYGMPAFKFMKKPLVYFAGYDTHIGFYPGAEAIKVFKKEISKYSFAKGTIRFDFDNVDYALIKKIIKFRIKSISTKGK